MVVRNSSNSHQCKAEEHVGGSEFRCECGRVFDAEEDTKDLTPASNPIDTGRSGLY
jgi:hypothetical protein